MGHPQCPDTQNNVIWNSKTFNVDNSFVTFCENSYIYERVWNWHWFHNVNLVAKPFFIDKINQIFDTKMIDNIKLIHKKNDDINSNFNNETQHTPQPSLPPQPWEIHPNLNINAWYFDAWSFTKYRPDTHVWKNRDCLHYRNPSVVDTWNLMIYNHLIGNI